MSIGGLYGMPGWERVRKPWQPGVSRAGQIHTPHGGEELASQDKQVLLKLPSPDAETGHVRGRLDV